MASTNKQSSSKSSHHGARAPKQSPEPKNPYQINPDETRDSFKPPLVLSGSNNYSKWSKEMNAALASKNKRGFVDGSIAAPAKDHKTYGAWKRCNDLVLSWIVKAVSPEIAKSVHGKDKAIDVWRDLKKRYSVDQKPHQQGQGHKQQPSQVIPKSKPGREVKKVQKLNRTIHPHPLTLKPSGAPYKCSGCRELGFGPRYCCETHNCNYVLHKDCANVIANNSLVFHRFFKESNFVFYKKKPDWRERFCNACGNDVLGFLYHCRTTGKDLHPCCFKLKHRISDKRVTLNLCDTVPKKCLICKGKKVENDIKGWSYVSSDGDYCCHVSCFKKVIIDKWKENYFSKEKMSLQTKTQITLTGKEMVKVGGSSEGSEVTKMLIKTTMSWVFRIVFAVIFGNATPLIFGVLEHIFN